MPLFSCSVIASLFGDLGVDEGRQRRAVRVDQVDPIGLPVGGGARQVEDLDEAGRQLRQVALGLAGGRELLVALVLHRDRGVLLVRADVDRVGLAVQRDAGDALGVGQAHDVETSGRLGEARAGVDDHEHVPADHGHRRGLVVDVAQLRQREAAGTFRGLGVADVEEADPLAERVGVDQRPAVLRDVRDLGDGLGRRADVLRQVLVDGVRRGAVEAPLAADVGGRLRDGDDDGGERTGHDAHQGGAADRADDVREPRRTRLRGGMRHGQTMSGPIIRTSTAG
jgi:hypothetical protein